MTLVLHSFTFVSDNRSETGSIPSVKCPKTSLNVNSHCPKTSLNVNSHCWESHRVMLFLKIITNTHLVGPIKIIKNTKEAQREGGVECGVAEGGKVGFCERSEFVQKLQRKKILLSFLLWRS